MRNSSRPATTTAHVCVESSMLLKVLHPVRDPPGRGRGVSNLGVDAVLLSHVESSFPSGSVNTPDRPSRTPPESGGLAQGREAVGGYSADRREKRLTVTDTRLSPPGPGGWVLICGSQSELTW